MKKIIFLIPILLLTGFISGQNTATLSISISNIELNHSKIFVGLYDNETDFKLKSSAVDSIIIIPNLENIQVSLKNITIGIYAVAVFQDLNNNGKLDSRELKIPIEPVGISNHALRKLSLPPTFKKAQFNLKKDTLIFISLMKNKQNPIKK